MTVLEKEALWKGTGAAAVDMESGAAAEVAEQLRTAFCSPESDHRSGSSVNPDQRGSRCTRKRHDRRVRGDSVAYAEARRHQ